MKLTALTTLRIGGKSGGVTDILEGHDFEGDESLIDRGLAEPAKSKSKPETKAEAKARAEAEAKAKAEADAAAAEKAKVEADAAAAAEKAEAGAQDAGTP